MIFIVDGQRIATENFLVGQLYKITYKNENIVYAMCDGIGHDFVMFISDNPRIITLNVETAQTIDTIMPAEAGSMYDYNALENKPQINSHELSGNKSSSDLGLQAALSEAQQAAVDSGIDSTKVEQIETNKTNISTVNNALGTATNNLQSQIDAIITPVTQDSEVIAARVGENGHTYSSLKSRLDNADVNFNKFVNAESTLLFPDFTTGQYIIDSETNKVMKGTTAAWQGALIPVTVGETYAVNTMVYGSTYYAVIFTDDNKNVISAYDKNTESVNLPINNLYVVPTGATRMYVNNRVNQISPTVRKIQFENNYLKPLTICSVNCGTFDHYKDGESRLTDNEYLNNWKSLINSTKFDIFALTDCPYETTETIFNENNMFTPIVKETEHLSTIPDQYYESRISLGNTTKLTVTSTVTVGGTTYTNESRNKFLRSEFIYGNKTVAIYAVHASPQLSAGYENLRAAQYADLIADASNYDVVIMVGDFNAQNIIEYNIFTTAGYKIANGGYLGAQNTLRNIPADNIIVSGNLNIDFFDVITEYILNTDHCPLMAEIRYIG